MFLYSILTTWQEKYFYEKTHDFCLVWILNVYKIQRHFLKPWQVTNRAKSVVTLTNSKLLTTRLHKEFLKKTDLGKNVSWKRIYYSRNINGQETV